MPFRVKLMLKKVENELFKQTGQAVANEVAKTSLPAGFLRQPVLVNELADVEEENVNTVVTMKLDATKMFRTNLDGLHR